VVEASVANANPVAPVNTSATHATGTVGDTAVPARQIPKPTVAATR
jgi:hypothetical protein